jgi:hypothetical protein
MMTSGQGFGDFKQINRLLHGKRRIEESISVDPWQDTIENPFLGKPLQSFAKGFIIAQSCQIPKTIDLPWFLLDLL